jgi:hypothetical protein
MPARYLPSQEPHFVGCVNEIALMSDRRRDFTLTSEKEQEQHLIVVYAAKLHVEHLAGASRCFQVEPPPEARGVIPDDGLFEELRLKWQQEAGDTSSITKIVTCTSYQRIIGMGRVAVPLIMRQMESEGDDPDHWGWALRSITGANPVSKEAAGDSLEIAKAWLAWGRLRYAW